MSVFAAAMDRIFTHASMAAPALWISATTSEERPIRIIRRIRSSLPRRPPLSRPVQREARRARARQARPGVSRGAQ